MSSYINIHSLAYPFYEGDIRLLHPEIREDQTGDTFPCPPEFALIEDTAPPIYDGNTHWVQKSMPFNINGVWKYQWSIIELTAEQIARNQLGLEKYNEIEALINAQNNPTS